MFRKILVLAAAFVLFAGCITSQPAETATLQLTSSPAGAEIYLDNQYHGTTPATVADVVPGSHTLEFRLNGYRSWKSSVTVPAGTSNYFGALSAIASTGPGTGITPSESVSAPPRITITTGREEMVIGDSNLFSGTAVNTDLVVLWLYGPGYYANGIALDTVKPDAAELWSYTWNPGTKIQPGTYTIIAYDRNQIVSARSTFRAIGNGVVSVTPSSYAVARGEAVTLSGQCTTGARYVHLTLIGPERFSGGIDLGNFPVTAQNTWSTQYMTDLSMPAGVYSVYVNDVPQTTTGSSQFTIGFAS